MLLRPITIVTLVWLVIATIASIAFNQTGEEWHDEAVFVPTVHSFSQAITLDKLRSYPQVLGPTTFVIYGLWERLVGSELWRLRLLSVVLGSFFVTLMYFWLRCLTGSVRASLAGTILVMLNPYTIGIGVLVYTDMLAMLFVVTALLGITRSSALGVAAGLAGALLTRQFLVFVWIGTTVYLWWSWWARRGSSNVLRMAIASSAAILPLLWLFSFWGGIYPDSPVRAAEMAHNLRFRPEALTLYVSLMVLYAAPLAIVRLAKWRSSWKYFLAAIVPALVYIVAPVQSCERAQSSGLQTVGLLHRALVAVGLGGWFVHAVFLLTFLVGIAVVIALAKESIGLFRRREDSQILLLNLLIFSFLLTMAFCYQWWEKYFIPLLPIVAARWLLPFPEEQVTA
jgi:4-amino-4-deoxy-L-arabinose transferase-like glycosyltransferase